MSRRMDIKRSFIIKKSSNMSDPDGIGGKMQGHKAFDYYRKPADMVDRDVINAYGDCYPSGVEAEMVDQMHIDHQTFFSTDNSDGTCNRDEPVVVMGASLDEVMKMDAMMWSLQEALMKIEHDTNSTNDENGIIKVCENDSDERWIDEMNKRNMMVSSIIRDEICMDDEKVNDVPESNGKVNPIEYVDETSNDEGLNRSEKTKVEYIPMMSDVINPDQNGVGDERVVEFGGSSSDRRKTDNRVVNDVGRILNSDCRDFLLNNRIRDPAWLRSSEHRLIKMHGVATIVGRKVNWSHAVLCNDEKISFIKRLYLDHLIGYEGPEHIIFGSRLDVRKLGRMDIPGDRKSVV